MKDQLHRALDVDTIPERIVCLVPSLTEMLVDLGVKHKLLGVTKFCVHPQDIRTHAEVIGGTKNIKHDSIQALSPDFILANKEENELEDIEQLSESHPVYVSDINSIEDLLQLIRDLGELFSIPERSSQLADDIQTSFIKFSRETRHQPTLKVAYFIWRDPWMVVGSSTFIDYMLKLNNFDNVYDDSARYPEVDIHQLKPVDYIFLSSEPFPFKDQHKKEFEMNPDQIHIVDGEYFSWYGSRLLKAFDYFGQLRDKL
ncbi:ABC transporter substrate-binding protein [Psychroflexus sediminis]|uniref:ABC-type Fe3+-hydroxamate transport system, substrate-binding protein n=1 Tax=Psychroflexus sediminis TaxID=470826 RepID=A0A1G7WEX1_9FLAO|nr:helical backbone metal receptor [Psychroflexus sediminis]SDG70486.1 ABC-type Fe3+-hydroxamate transport system, substrate-binding protein [Psychroflexus sediminis]